MNKDRLGYYLVGWKKFYNKTLALIESKNTGFDLLWVFNDDVYSKIDWTVPIEVPLKTLYYLRAKQLREKYDYIVLNYSGGVDSHNALRAFLDNNIFIDEISIFTVEIIDKYSTDKTTSYENLNSEVKYSAIPMLNSVSHLLDSRTKITFKDISKSSLELLKNENWMDTVIPGIHYSITLLGRQNFFLSDKEYLNIREKNKTICSLYGVDKPLVVYQNNSYYAYFTDTSAMHSVPIELNKIDNSNIYTEFFYWNRDLPELVIKQAQEVKKHCELDPIKKNLWSKSLKTHIGEYREILNPIIYPEIETPTFQTGKQEQNFDRGILDNWFWEIANENQKQNLFSAVNYLKNNIDNSRFIKNDVKVGIQSTNSKFYKL
jgi:hypothetical protein